MTRWHANGTECMVTEGECTEDMEETEAAAEAIRRDFAAEEFSIHMGNLTR